MTLFRFFCLSLVITNKLNFMQLNNQKSIDNFKAGSVVFLDGDFSENRNIIKKKLKTLQITVKTSFEASVTHIIVGKNPKNAWKLIKENDLDYLDETQLYNFIKEIDQEDKFLLQDDSQTLVENLKDLLFSDDLANVTLGMQLIKSGGIPEILMEDLLLLSKTCPDAKIRTEMKKNLLTQAPAEWAELIKDKQVILKIKDASNSDIRDKLRKVSADIGMDNAAFLGMIIFKKYKKGLRFALSFINTQQRMEALYAITDGDFFDFHTGMGYTNYKNGGGSENQSYKVVTGVPFPKDHPNPLKIKKINFHNCKFDTLSKDIAIFAACEELDLSYNNLKTLPATLSNLSQLKKLDISCNHFSEFPEVLLKMPNLEEINLRYNSYANMNNNVPKGIPQEFYDKMPNCKILLKKDDK